MTINIGDLVIYNAKPTESAGIVVGLQPDGFQIVWGDSHSADVSSYTENELTVIPKPKYNAGDIITNGSSRYRIQGIFWHNSQTHYKYVMLVESVKETTNHVDNPDWFKLA